MNEPIGRRRFLLVGGSAIAATVMFGCTEDTPPRAENPGDSTTTTLPTLPADPADRLETDLLLSRTLASLEALAADTYTQLTASGLITDVSLATTLALFARHHHDHQTAMNLMIVDSKGTPVDQPNKTLDKTVVQPAIAAATTQDDALSLALTLEGTLAQSYVYAVNAATTSARRSQLMTIAGIEARHRAIAAQLLRPGDIGYVLPTAFAPADNPLPPDSMVAP
jgi:hypothetical protein